LGWEERKTMKAIKFSGRQKAFILKQGADGVPVAMMPGRGALASVRTKALSGTVSIPGG
jgi:hypothetical protein